MSAINLPNNNSNTGFLKFICSSKSKYRVHYTAFFFFALQTWGQSCVSFQLVLGPDQHWNSHSQVAQAAEQLIHTSVFSLSLTKITSSLLHRNGQSWSSSAALSKSFYGCRFCDYIWGGTLVLEEIIELRRGKWILPKSYPLWCSLCFATTASSKVQREYSNNSKYYFSSVYDCFYLSCNQIGCKPYLGHLTCPSNPLLLEKNGY